VRDLSQLLHPSMLDDLGLPDTLKWYLHGFSQRTGVRAELVQDQMDERLAPEVEVSAYRIIQEALTNVAKHAHATLCRVYVQRLPHSLLITVEDDGVGADAQGRLSEANGRGLGLVGIRERASALSGTVGFDSASGKGTRLTVELPLAGTQPGTATAIARTVASLPEV
jgi:signal transduction histidine kinase